MISALDLWRPSQIFTTIAEIDFQEQYEKYGICHWLFDLDGCLAPALSMDLHRESVGNILKARQQGWIRKAGVISNTGLPFFIPRMNYVGREIGAECCYAGVWPWTPMKPHQESYRRAVSMLGGDPSNTALVDDQLRNIRGGNIFGMRTILVKPHEPIPWWKRKSHLRDLQTVQAAGLHIPWA